MKVLPRSPLLLLALAAAVPACGGQRDDAPLTALPVGTYSFSGSVGTTTFHGLVLLSDDNVSVSSNLGACPESAMPRTEGATRAIQRARRLDVSCGGLRLQLQWDATGVVRSTARATVPVTREELVRGECIRWVRDARGVQSCAEYARVVREVRTQAQTTASIHQAG